MKLIDKLKQPEGRKLEFKEKLSTRSELAKTVIAFANDAGGELYFGVKDASREIVGVNEEDLMGLEEKICNIIHDQCAPIILPEISFHQHRGKYIIKTIVHKGNNPPYYMRSKGIEDGTFIRVGSTNRQATPEIIAEFKRQKKHISFDSELNYLKGFEELNIGSFKELYEETTGEQLTYQTLHKLELYKSHQGKKLPTNALILLSEDPLRKELFPYAKIECARFKGIVPGNFIDRKTIEVQVGLQADQAYQFVLRHISEVSIGYQGVYRKDRWGNTPSGQFVK